MNRTAGFFVFGHFDQITKNELMRYFLKKNANFCLKLYFGGAYVNRLMFKNISLFNPQKYSFSQKLEFFSLFSAHATTMYRKTNFSFILAMKKTKKK